MRILIFVLVGFVSYFVGNLSFARIISKNIMKDDITKHGSGNPGTANMYRAYGYKIGVFNLILDILKGVIPTLIAFLVWGFEFGFVAGTCAILGHVYPVIYKFKGGKGIATALGVFAVLLRPVWLIFVVLVAMLILIYLFEYTGPVCLSTIAFLVCYESYKFAGNFIICSCLFIIFVLTWFAHRKNILRLLTGKENKVVLRKNKKQKNQNKTDV